MKNIKTLRGKRGMLANPKSVKTEQLTSNPQEILDILFGKDVFTVADFNSFESIWNDVLFSDKFPYKDKIHDIVEGFVRYNDKNNSFQLEHNKLALPEEVIEYCKANGIEIPNE